MKFSTSWLLPCHVAFVIHWSACNAARWSNYDATKYYRADEILELCKDSAKHRPGIATSTVIGYTSENREICMMHINDPATDGPDKLTIFIEAGIHPREWLSPSAALFVAGTLLLRTNPVGTALLKVAEFYIVPMINPDGYEYTFTHDRLWRKNRNRCRNERDKCCGVDLNRNFNSHFGEIGVSMFKCSAVYPGPYYESEQESYALVSQVIKIKHKLDLYVSLHSYGQVLLVPYGFSRDAFPDNYDDMFQVATHASEQMTQVYGYKYTAERSGAGAYIAAGCSDDWAREKMKIPYSFTMELRPDDRYGSYGFKFPSRLGYFCCSSCYCSIQHECEESKRIVKYCSLYRS